MEGPVRILKLDRSPVTGEHKSQVALLKQFPEFFSQTVSSTSNAFRNGSLATLTRKHPKSQQAQWGAHSVSPLGVTGKMQPQLLPIKHTYFRYSKACRDQWSAMQSAITPKHGSQGIEPRILTRVHTINVPTSMRASEMVTRTR